MTCEYLHWLEVGMEAFIDMWVVWGQKLVSEYTFIIYKMRVVEHTREHETPAI